MWNGEIVNNQTDVKIPHGRRLMVVAGSRVPSEHQEKFYREVFEPMFITYLVENFGYEFEPDETGTPVFREVPTGMHLSFISGAARTGADGAIITFCKKFNLPYIKVPANWEQHGKRAGYIRNEVMAQIARYEYLVTFHDGSSKGTKDMHHQASKYGMEVTTFNFDKKAFYSR